MTPGDLCFKCLIFTRPYARHWGYEIEISSWLTTGGRVIPSKGNNVSRILEEWKRRPMMGSRKGFHSERKKKRCVVQVSQNQQE